MDETITTGVNSENIEDKLNELRDAEKKQEIQEAAERLQEETDLKDDIDRFENNLEIYREMTKKAFSVTEKQDACDLIDMVILKLTMLSNYLMMNKQDLAQLIIKHKERILSLALVGFDVVKALKLLKFNLKFSWTFLKRDITIPKPKLILPQKYREIYGLVPERKPIDLKKKKVRRPNRRSTGLK